MYQLNVPPPFRRNGVTTRDLTTVETETGNVYVVMPVPASVRKAAPTPR